MGWLALLGSANIVGIVGPMFPVWNRPDFRAGRTYVYMASAAAAFLPGLHYAMIYGTTHLPHSYDNPAFLNLGLTLFQYTLGGVIYATRFPEW
jgi:predicted membrane channel-forming protein YqfA (hemolysin III family)